MAGIQKKNYIKIIFGNDRGAFPIKNRKEKYFKNAAYFVVFLGVPDFFGAPLATIHSSSLGVLSLFPHFWAGKIVG